MHILLIDNYDSFTYNLYDYVAQNDVQCEVLKNDEISIEEIEAKNYDGIILSPGPKTPDDAGITKEVIRHFYDKKPILGICLGQQAIGEIFGATLVKANYPMHGKTSEVYFETSINSVQENRHFLFEKLNAPFRAMRYHSLILQDIKAPLRVIAKTNSGEIMAIAHENKLLCGVQFHPESILTENGLQIIRNWLFFVKKNSPKL
ncbi:MAG TPA: aminodeoxychorismate/anthranilate synthase component II [Chitinophagales bacterium]